MRICFCFVGEKSSAKKLSCFPVCYRRNFFVKAITFPSSLSPPLVLSPARKSRSRGGTKSKNESGTREQLAGKQTTRVFLGNWIWKLETRAKFTKRSSEK